MKLLLNLLNILCSGRSFGLEQLLHGCCRYSVSLDSLKLSVILLFAAAHALVPNSMLTTYLSCFCGI